MNYNIKRGGFLGFGATVLKEYVEFTINSNKPVSLCLYDNDTKELLSIIDIPKEYKRGDVYSVDIFGIDTEKTCYRFRTSDGEFIDRFAKIIYGRNSFGESVKNEDLYGGFSASVLPNPYEKPLKEDLIIYKFHLRGLTMNKYKTKDKGNYLSLVKSLPDIIKLGFNCIEVLPIYDFDEKLNEEFTNNYWGYGDKNAYYFAPKSSYFLDEPDKNARALVDLLHKSNMSIVMEFCFSNNISEDYILSVIRFWAHEYGVDGFRFIGENVPQKRLIEDPFLSDRYLIFENDNFKNSNALVENNSFLYTLRSIQNHMDKNAKDLCDAIIKNDSNSFPVNYVASSNGFTLLDSYSYIDKHNLDNRENNTDGNSFCLTTNCGIEGDTRDKNIKNDRLTHIRSALALLFLSKGVPLLNAGDELLNSQKGNNNPYCQDNSIGWVNYSKGQDAQDLKEYVSSLIDFRKKHNYILKEPIIEGNKGKKNNMPHISFHEREPWSYDKNNNTKTMGILFSSNNEYEDVMVIFNFYSYETEYSLPSVGNKSWYLVTNTSSFKWTNKHIKKDDKLLVPPGTVSILVSK